VIVLDTHIWIDLIDERSPLSARQQRAIDQAELIVVSTISCWEIAMLVRQSRISLDRPPNEWITEALRYQRLALANVTRQVAVAAGSLTKDQFHGDPADRIIAMTAKVRNCALLTNDAKIAKWGLVPVIA
jgi:PIN domain nuclease of toxin-antitoxin system